MEYDFATALFPFQAQPFFPELSLALKKQEGGRCVSTGLSLLSGEDPFVVRDKINTQDPRTWSQYLTKEADMKLAYCAADFRKLRHFCDELLAHNDLFTISTYTPLDAELIAQDPDEKGWICGSHFFLLYKDTIYDTRFNHTVKLSEYRDLERYVKRIFRVVPASLNGYGL